MSILGELWAEVVGTPHDMHVAIPWGLSMLVGFLGAAIVALLARALRNRGKGPGGNNH